MSTFRSYVSVKSDSSLEDLDFNFEHSDEEIGSLVASDNNLFDSNFYIDDDEEEIKKKKSSGSEVEGGDEKINENDFDSLAGKEITDDDFEKKSDSFKSEDGKVEEDKKQRHESLVSEERLNLIGQVKKLWEERKYEAVLNEFEVVKISLESSNRTLIDVTEDFKNLYNAREIEFDKSFQEFRARFFEIGECLKTKENKLSCVNKKIGRLLNKIQSRMENLKETRIVLFKLKITYKKINDQLCRINILGEGYTVTEYENLSMIKNSNVEILHKRERKIDKHHDKCVSTINMLSQVKEQSSSLDDDLEKFKKECKELECSKNKLQDEFNKLRREKEAKRKKILLLQRNLFSMNPELVKEISDRGIEYARLRSRIKNLQESDDS
ncbi:uncharacterized protein LOC130675716 [Microplitis mediator]|uniref:uncharacterized protein LOC130675716 n=1 Tax=Microplitis mediator TaxID=375433 RepID=UPI002557AFF4|nr:uncharacterized protein LOC130675716 [Microplitis mediator]